MRDSLCKPRRQWQQEFTSSNKNLKRVKQWLCISKRINPFLPKTHLLILLRLIPDDFTCQSETHWAANYHPQACSTTWVRDVENNSGNYKEGADLYQLMSTKILANTLANHHQQRKPMARNQPEACRCWDHDEMSSPRISREQSFLVPCRYRDLEITEPKNRLPRTSSALPIKIYLLKVFPCFNSQEVE